VGNDYIPPKEELDDGWDALDDGDAETQEETDNSTAAARITVSKDGVFPHDPWWEQFNDETLSALMEKALTENNDLKVAQARIAEARADERTSSAQRYPQVDASATLSRATLDSLSSRKLDTVHQEGINANWDIDPFGGNRRRNEGATASTQAYEADFSQTRLNLLADVARNYSHLRAAQKQRELTLRNLGIQRDTLRITHALRKAQNVTELDVARVDAQIAATQARLPPIRTDIRAAIHRLSVLTGKQPSALNSLLMPAKPMLVMPRNLAVLPPVATIAQRPDVHAAERRLAQTSALSNAAFADFFPKLSLSAFFGTRHSDFYGSLSPWSAAASAMFPLLDFGRIRSQMHAANARQEQAFYLYKQAVLLALEETENSLDAYINERQRSILLQKVAVDQARAVNIAREQYRAGIITQLDLLDAQRNQLDAESGWVFSLQTATDNLIQLYRALGLGPEQ